jgi:hypothetical protein
MSSRFLLRSSKRESQANANSNQMHCFHQWTVSASPDLIKIWIFAHKSKSLIAICIGAIGQCRWIHSLLPSYHRYGLHSSWVSQQTISPRSFNYSLYIHIHLSSAHILDDRCKQYIALTQLQTSMFALPLCITRWYTDSSLCPWQHNHLFAVYTIKRAKRGRHRFCPTKFSRKLITRSIKTSNTDDNHKSSEQ